MKNIHLIPTDKPSRLSILNSGKLNFGAEIMSSSNSKSQNIYITSDEEIKEGDWTFDGENPYKWTEDDVEDCYNPGFENYKGCKKIILTTDQDLIKDGVQKISDEFLEWFVKNPSCEEVETKIEFIQTPDNLKDGFYYKIIIPIEGTPQETNEEASKRIYPDKTTPGWIDHWSATERRCFIEGAQWSQQEILYFLYEEITERRPYSSSKMCEVVIEFIQKMNKK